MKKDRKKATGMVAGSSGTRKKQKREKTGDGSDSDDVEDLLVLAKADGKIYGTKDEHAATEIEANKPVDSSKQGVSSFIKCVPLSYYWCRMQGACLPFSTKSLSFPVVHGLKMSPLYRCMS